MKKKILSLVLATGLVLSLSACSGGIDGEEARTYVSDFFDTVETGDYAAAAAFLHPERPADLEAFFQGLESQEGLDFSNIVIDKYTGFSSSYYDSTVKGAAGMCWTPPGNPPLRKGSPFKSRQAESRMHSAYGIFLPQGECCSAFCNLSALPTN